MKRARCEIVFSTDDKDNPIYIAFPSPMNPHEIDDLDELLTIWMRSLRRQKPECKPGEDCGEN